MTFSREGTELLMEGHSQRNLTARYSAVGTGARTMCVMETEIGQLNSSCLDSRPRMAVMLMHFLPQCHN